MGPNYRNTPLYRIKLSFCPCGSHPQKLIVLPVALLRLSIGIHELAAAIPLTVAEHSDVVAAVLVVGAREAI